MNSRIIVACALLALACPPRPASAQDRPPSAPAAESDEKALDELDEVRVHEEFLNMELQNTKMQVQQWMQMANQMRFAGLQAAESTEESRKQRVAAIENAKHALEELTDAYMQRTRELRRASRRRAALEQQISARAGGPARKDEEAKPGAGLLIKAGGTYINPRQVSYVVVHKDEKDGSYVQVFFAAGDQRIILKGEQADSMIEALERISR